MMKTEARTKRALRVRTNLAGTAVRPRLSVFRSNKNLSAQLIDDANHITLLGLSTTALKAKGTKGEQAAILGKAIAEAAGKKGIKTALFDRGSYRFHGRVKAVADAARAGGLKF